MHIMNMDNVPYTWKVNQKQQGHKKANPSYKTAKPSPYTSKEKMWKFLWELW